MTASRKASVTTKHANKNILHTSPEMWIYECTGWFCKDVFTFFELCLTKVYCFFFLVSSWYNNKSTVYENTFYSITHRCTVKLLRFNYLANITVIVVNLYFGKPLLLFIFSKTAKWPKNCYLIEIFKKRIHSFKLK